MKAIKNVCICTLETGDIIFLLPNEKYTRGISSKSLKSRLANAGSQESFQAKIFYDPATPNVWYLNIFNDGGNSIQGYEFKFYLPESIFKNWASQSYTKREALVTKEKYFSRLYIFTRAKNNRLPFVIVDIDKKWMNDE